MLILSRHFFFLGKVKKKEKSPQSGILPSIIFIYILILVGVVEGCHLYQRAWGEKLERIGRVTNPSKGFAGEIAV